MLVDQIIGKSITDSNLSNFLLIRFLATDPIKLQNTDQFSAEEQYN